MNVMACLAAFLLALTPQETLEERIAALLRTYPDEEDLEPLLDGLEALGADALPLIARALAEDLRDGMAAAAAPALVDALVGHRDTIEPLRAAFRDPRTSPSGRLEIARALDDLGDDSWREEIRRMSGDPQADPLLRGKALALLDLATLVDDPRERVVEEPRPRESLRRKKSVREAPPPDTMAAALLFGGALIALAGLLLWALRRKD